MFLHSNMNKYGVENWPKAELKVTVSHTGMSSPLSSSSKIHDFLPAITDDSVVLTDEFMVICSCRGCRMELVT